VRDAITAMESIMPIGTSSNIVIASAAYLVHAEPHQTGSAAPWLTKWDSWQGWWQHRSFPAC
jgi:hypothetical protein